MLCMIATQKTNHFNFKFIFFIEPFFHVQTPLFMDFTVLKKRECFLIASGHDDQKQSGKLLLSGFPLLSISWALNTIKAML